ncbi:MAG: hypothetical protein B6245_19090 [Desulfobacteraceae bacterium 4572_88]|nr:MAG: hypothetical protein B6245_19090 [Desulfobacteraceae bacterium 4572_88]
MKSEKWGQVASPSFSSQPGDLSIGAGLTPDLRQQLMDTIYIERGQNRPVKKTLGPDRPEKGWEDHG